VQEVLLLSILKIIAACEDGAPHSVIETVLKLREVSGRHLSLVNVFVVFPAFEGAEGLLAEMLTVPRICWRNTGFTHHCPISNVWRCKFPDVMIQRLPHQ
jgi:hypothetical protein